MFCLFVGIISVIALQRLLPQRKSPLDGNDEEDFTTELLVPSDNHYIGCKYTEIMRIGLLMNIIILIANIFITTLVFPL